MGDTQSIEPPQLPTPSPIFLHPNLESIAWDLLLQDLLLKVDGVSRLTQNIYILKCIEQFTKISMSINFYEEIFRVCLMLAVKVAVSYRC